MDKPITIGEIKELFQTLFFPPMESLRGDNDGLKIHSHPPPNFNERPDGTKIDTVVVHATVFEIADEVIQHFTNPQMSVSAHYTIESFRTSRRRVVPVTPAN